MEKLSFPLFLFLLLLQILSCGRKDYAVSTTWFFINQTDSVLTFLPSALNEIIYPNDTIIFRSNAEGPKDSDPLKIHSVFVPSVVKYGNGLCDTQAFSEFNIRNTNNFEIKTITKQNFEYTYRFTKEMLEKAKPCD